MQQTRIGRLWRAGALAALAASMVLPQAWAQPQRRGATDTAALLAQAGQPDAEQTKRDLDSLLSRYPPLVHRTLAMDPSLLGNEQYMAAYPEIKTFLDQHPGVVRNPSFYLGDASPNFYQPEPGERMWRDIFQALTVFLGFSMAIGLLVWLIRTFIDSRRWNRLAKVQTEVHTKLLDRFNNNEDLLAYMQSPAGARFLEATPIRLDAAPRSVGAPLGRILWSVQGGLVLVAGGIGLQWVASGAADEMAKPFQALGVLAIALGIGFLASAIISFVISQKMGLLERQAPAPEATNGGTRSYVP